ncbi:GMC oxidoreductase [Rhodococcus qingshengii]|uniref:GMC oxidoreductase n=1 Tax=Rhodococcus qingshengii TaxID=334542 RepID=UPI00071D61EE|nr:GMC family oxidoreductase [Rhodococcus qingshengii]KSU76392.1 cholesterol oxidase [Rhodococcus qingshengii]SCC43228.1 cholesterol oxidase [Rhodococcus qingshengii]
MTATHYDVVVIGSGFGGSVAALRLTEKGYRVGVLEAGRRFADDELPETSWRLRKYLWAPWIGCYGVQRIHLLPDVLVMAGAGVGGGSLNYANTLYQPPNRFFEDRQWAHITDWHDELAPYYDQAKRMLGVRTNPSFTPADAVMKDVAEEMGVGETFTSTPVGVFFGEAGVSVPDPFFGGKGPERTGCTECGGCMTGCRVGAKNTLVKNYLHLAEQAGARVHPLTTVTDLRPAASGGYRLLARRTDGVGRREVRFTADQVVVAAGTYGTARLLLGMKESGALPGLSDTLGTVVRTNSEAVLAATSKSRRRNFTQGVAITSSFHPDDHTHIEPVRYGKGSNAIGLLQTVLSDGGGRTPRVLKTLAVAARHPGAFLRSLSVRNWSERTVIALVMQTDDNSLELSKNTKRFGRSLTSRPGPGDPPPQWIPQGHTAIRKVAEKIDGDPGGSIAEIVNIPMTAHFLGGCAIGDSASSGVVDPYLRAYGHEGLHVMDGSVVSANLGVNPSLTITAQAERACAMWPNKGGADARPKTGEPYVRIDPTLPSDPVVPTHAPGALRLPLTIRAEKVSDVERA